MKAIEQKNTYIFLKTRLLDFKKIDAIRDLWNYGKMFDRQFFNKTDPIWENWKKNLFRWQFFEVISAFETRRRLGFRDNNAFAVR